MPRYHFHVEDGVSMPDEEGQELRDLTAARDEAVKLAGALLRDEPRTFWNGDQWDMNVCDDRGLTLFRLTFFATDAPAVGMSGAR